MDIKRNQQICDFIGGYWWKYGYGPTAAEIAEHMGMATTTMWRSLKGLRASGFITWQSHKPRTIRLIRPIE